MSEFSAEIYTSILGSLPNGIYVVDRERRIQFWNSGAEQIAGYLRHQVIGRMCPDDLLVHCDADNVTVCGASCPLQETMHDGKPRELWGYLRHKAGHRVPVHVRSVAVRDDSGAIVGAAETFDEQIHPSQSNALIQSHPAAGPVTVDPQTGLRDHHAILEEVCSSLSGYTDTEIPFGVLGIAVDGLEAFGRSHGKRGADAMFYMVAQTLDRNLPPEDRLGRWSEDRLVVVVANCAPAALPTIAQRLARIIALDELPWWGDRLPVSVTIGGTVVRHGDTAESILERMEEALLAAAPCEGRNVKIA